MLDALRQASQNWIGRTIMAIVMGVLSLSFAIWGIGDIFRGIGGNTLAKVGSTEISADAYRNAYQIQLQRLQQQARRPITSEQARAMGLDQQVLGKLLSDAELDERARSLGLAMSDKEIVRTAMEDPTFRGANGKFDPLVFQSILRDNGLTEQSFVREQRGVYLRRELADALIGQLEVPRVSLEAINRFRNEARSIDYFTLPASAAGDIPAPSDADLKQFYEDRKSAWQAPQYRKLVVLAISPESLAKTQDVSDADGQARYEQEKARFGTPETRDVQQVVFASEADAKAAKAKIDAGASLEQAAADAKAGVVDLGTVKQGDLFDKPIADAAFGVAPGAVSAPVKGQFGWVLVRASKVTPAAVKPYAEVAAQVKQEIALERARKAVDDLRDKVEDQRASGRPLAEAAKSAGLEVRTIDAVDAQGNDKNGKPVDVPDRDALLKAAFASDIGVDNDVIATREGGDLWFEVAGIEQARQRTFDEVKAQVEAGWRDDEIAKRLSAKASEIVKQIDGGADLAALASANGASVAHAADIKRIGTTSVPEAITNAVFTVPVKAGGSAAGQGQSRTVFKVLDSHVPPLDAASEVSKNITAQLREQLTEDVLSEYLAELQQKLGVTVNQTAYRSLTGGGGDALN